MSAAVWLAGLRFTFWRRVMLVWPCMETFDRSVRAHRDRANARQRAAQEQQR